MLRSAGAAVCAAGLVLASAWAATPDQLPPNPSPAHITDGQNRLASGQLAPVAEAKSRADALYAEASIALDSPDGDSAKALDQLREVVALDPHNEDAQVKIARAFLQSGQVNAAYDQLRSAAAAALHSTKLDALLGYAQHLRGENDEAVRLSTQTLTRDPTESTSMRVLLETAGEQNDLAGAVVHIEDILKADGPGVPASAWLALGRLYVEIARNESHTLSDEVVLKTLLPIYQQAAAKAPPDVERLTLLAETYQDLGRREEALATLRRAADLEPGNVDIILRCARLEMDLGEKEAGLKKFREAYDLNPSLTGLREMLGRLYLDNDRFTEAAELLRDAVAEAPSDPGLRADLGVAYAGAHQDFEAAACFQQAFASPICPPEAYLKLAVFQLAHDKITEAGRTLADAQVRFPQSAKIRFYEAIQYRYAKKYVEALSALAAMRTLASPSDSDVFNPYYYLESAMTMSLAHQDDRIEPVLREGLAKYPDNPELMNELAFSWADAGLHLPEALDLGKRAEQLDPDNGAIVDTCGWVYFKMGKINDALPYLQRAAVLTKNDPVVLQHVGDVLLQAGRRREAIATWRTALAKDPANRALITRIDAALAQANHAYSRSAP